MSIKKYHIKRRLARLLSLYLKGKSSPSQKDFVEKFYDSLGQYTTDDIRFDKEKDDVKSRIDQYIRNQAFEKDVKAFPYVKVVAAIAIFALSALLALFIWSPQGLLEIEKTELVRSDKAIPVFSIVKDGQT